MEKEKIEAIKNISSEVNEFHPLLRVLFAKLPNISNLEYTQGPNEMGADFVLTKKDSTLDDIEYIGVIVKIGQIKQDHQEIDRQIEECEIERTIEGGKRKIYLSEIWIVSNENITKQAQEKIHHKYKNKNIKFISGEKVTDFVDRYYPSYWKNASIEINEYFAKVNEYCESIIINKSIFDSKHKEVYIDQDLVHFEVSKESYNKNHKKAKKTNINAILEKEDLILIEATMGTGKSTLLAHIAKKYSNNENYKKCSTIPIITTAKKFFTEFESDISKLIEWTKTNNNLNNIDNFIVLIDGLDEINLNPEELIAELKKIYLSFNNQNNLKVIISSRNIDDPDAEIELQKSFVRYRLCQLTVKQVISLVVKICDNASIKDKLEKDLDKSHLFKVLPKTPISAILLAKLLNENIQEIPSTMTELYTKYMELVLGRWDINKGLQSQSEYDVKNNVTINAANFLISNSLDEIPEGDFKSIYDEYVKNRNIPNINKEDLYLQLIKNEEIFSHSKKNGTINFKHRTFAEFFAAQKMHRDNTAHIDENIFSLYWNTVYFFYLGIKRDSEILIKAINEINFTNDSTKMLKIFSNGSFLLAAHLTPYATIKDSVDKSLQDAAALYKEITTPESKHPLTCLSKIHLICLFTHTLCESYGYDFFTPALTEIALDTYTTHNPSDEQLIKLFLTNSILISLSKKTAYDTMIENYGQTIPLELQIGIKCHSEDHNTSTLVIKKFIKKFDKNLKTNIGYKNAVMNLMSPPKTLPPTKR